MIHLAGPAITVGSHRRQRCSWCGTIIEDVDLANVAMAVCGERMPANVATDSWAVLAAAPELECRREAGHSGKHSPVQLPGDFQLAGWAFEALLEIDGENPRITSLVEPETHEDGTTKIPDGSCMSLPAEVTL